MKRPRRTHSLRSAPLAPSNLSLRSPQSASIDDVPEVLERSEFRLSDVKPSVQGIPSKGILVKLFLVSRKDMRSAGDSEGTMWVVSSPDAIHWTPRKSKDAHKTNARATDKASYAAKAWPAFKPRMKAKVSGGKAGRQKEQRSSAAGGRNVAEQPVQEGHSESDDTSDEQEGEEDEEDGEDDAGEDEAEEDDAGEDDAGEDDAGKDDAGEDDAGEDDAGEDGGLDEKAVVNDEHGHDTEEQDGDGHNKALEESQTEEAGERDDEGDEGEEDLSENMGKEVELEAEGQQEAVREGEREGEEKTGDETEPHSETRGKDFAVHDGEEEEHGGDGEAGKEQGDQDQVQGAEDAMGQRVTANNRDGPWRSWETGDTRGEEDTESCANPNEEETTARDENRGAEQRRKRALEGDEAMDNSLLEEHPSKRSKSERGDNEDDAATEDSFERGLETPPRPRTPSLMSSTLSPGSTIKIVRQTSVVPGLEDTESAVWDAAQRDVIFTSLSEAHQKKLVSTALSLGSEEGIEELRCFVSNARIDGKQGGKALMSGFNPNIPDLSARSQLNNNAPDPQSRYLAHVSTLYRRLDALRKNETLVIITKRASLAALAQCRESLVPKGVGGNRARDANIKLFHAIFPQHVAVERPEDRATNLAASQDWIRLRNRLQEGRVWLKVRDRFGGVGAFLALPPQCVPDSHVSKISARNFGSLLRLLDVAWRALDDRARRTMNALVSFALAEQPLPAAALALERFEVGIGAVPAGLSPMLAGWSVSDLGAEWSDDSVTASPREREVKGKLDTPQTLRPTTAATGREEVVTIAESGMPNKTVLAVDSGLLENVDFDEPLSQQI